MPIILIHNIFFMDKLNLSSMFHYHFRLNLSTNDKKKSMHCKFSPSGHCAIIKTDYIVINKIYHVRDKLQIYNHFRCEIHITMDHTISLAWVMVKLCTATASSVDVFKQGNRTKVTEQRTNLYGCTARLRRR